VRSPPSHVALTVQTEAVVVVMVGVTPLFCVVATVNVEKVRSRGRCAREVTVGGIRTAGAAVTGLHHLRGRSVVAGARLVDVTLQVPTLLIMVYVAPIPCRPS